jgi:hypothetical protein
MTYKQDLYDIITDLRKKNPRAKIPETAFPKPSCPPRSRARSLRWGSGWRRDRRTNQEVAIRSTHIKLEDDPRPYRFFLLCIGLDIHLPLPKPFPIHKLANV